jgi:hypothetical protein
MLPYDKQYGSKVAHFYPIQIQRINRSTPDRCKSDQFYKTGIPTKMLSPQVNPWIKKLNSLSAFRVSGLCFGELLLFSTLPKAMSFELRAASLIFQNEKKYSFSVGYFEISPNGKSYF